VVLGGTLEQHLADNPGRLEHYRDRPRAEHAHGLKILPDSAFEEIFETTKMPVNSHHHQGLDRVAAPLEQVAWADDGVLEGVVSRDHTWVIGVQWHPEVMAPIESRQMTIFRAFLEAAEAYSGATLRQAASA
jgi:putative glutamine amidotransferase